MDYLQTLTDADIFAHPQFEQPGVFEQRATVKAIVQNSDGKFGLVTNTVHGVYLLPGGGADSSDLMREIQRECVEEIGFEVEILGEIGRTHEYRNREAKEYVTTCYVARATKEVLEDMRTEAEKRNGLRVEWFDRDEVSRILTRQIESVRRGEVKFYNTAFNVVRDAFFFKHTTHQQETRHVYEAESLDELKVLPDA